MKLMIGDVDVLRSQRTIYLHLVPRPHDSCLFPHQIAGLSTSRAPPGLSIWTSAASRCHSRHRNQGHCCGFSRLQCHAICTSCCMLCFCWINHNPCLPWHISEYQCDSALEYLTPSLLLLATIILSGPHCGTIYSPRHGWDFKFTCL